MTWKDSPWQITNARDPQRPCRLTRPFGLIGSATFCDVRLPPEQPHLLYFLHRSPVGVEAWALDPSAAVNSVSLLSGGVLADQFEVQFEVGQEAPIKAWPVVKFEFQQMSRSVLLNQRVTIVGSRAPSTIRIPDNHLAACQLVLTWDGSDLSAITLPGPRSQHGVQILPVHTREFIKYKHMRMQLSGVADRSAQARNQPAATRRPPVRQPVPRQRQLAGVGVTESAVGTLPDIEASIRSKFKSRFERQLKLRMLLLSGFAIVMLLAAVWLAWWLFQSLSPFLGSRPGGVKHELSQSGPALLVSSLPGGLVGGLLGWNDDRR